MNRKSVFSVCGMCSVRCPIQVDVADGECEFIMGNPHSPLKGALCARGASGLAFLRDDQRPQRPMIRAGGRGEGRWKHVSWDEALDYVADKLKAIMGEHGARSVLLSDRGGPFTDVSKAFARGLGTPNYTTHDASCARNVQHASLSTSGIGRASLVYDLKNAKHVVLQTRNLLEAINVKEVNDLLDGLAAGGKLTVIDIRANVSGGKADNFFLIKPGTDHAFNLAVLNVLIEENLYKADYVEAHVKDFDALAAFVKPYTPEWAEKETGAQAGRIRDLARQLAAAAPAVVWHPGWMVARYGDSFHVCRTAYLINALLGSIGAKGGLPLGNPPSEVGRKGLKKLVDLYPAPTEKRADGVGWKYPHLDANEGILQYGYKAIETGDPYPLKAYIAFRHDPLMAMPDPEAQKKIFEKLDLLVSITFSWSDTAWHSDVVLPMSSYLERDSILGQKNGLKPQFFSRRRAVDPIYDTRADWEIFSGLAKRLGMDKLAFEKIEDLWAYQLEGTGVSVEDIDKKGFVELCEKPFYRDLATLKFKTPSGKIEVINEKWDSQGLLSLKPYEAPQGPPSGRFRIAFGRCGLHTQGHTVNNPVLNELMPENVLWMNRQAAAAQGLGDGETVEVIGADGVSGGTIKTYLTDLIHPEAVFMVHGFGHRISAEKRAKGKGVADQELMPGGLDKVDPSGGGLNLQEHFVEVRKA